MATDKSIESESVSEEEFNDDMSSASSLSLEDDGDSDIRPPSRRSSVSSAKRTLHPKKVVESDDDELVPEEEDQSEEEQEQEWNSDEESSEEEVPEEEDDDNDFDYGTEGVPSTQRKRHMSGTNSISLPTEDSAATIEKILASENDKYLIKYKGKSYLHTEWLTVDNLKNIDPNAASRVKRYLTKPTETFSQQEVFNPAYLWIDRVLDEDEDYFLVKWKSLPYEESTWETLDDLKQVEGYETHIDAFRKRQKPSELVSKAQRPALSSWKKLEESPVYKHGNQLRKYQLEGLNWLMFCWFKGQGSIIADEMGLGKTVQTVSFIDQIHSRYNIQGPFLVVAPLSTLAHWEREFKNWTDLNVVVFHGSAKSRDIIVEHEMFFGDNQKMYKFHVLITTYEMISSGFNILKPIPWKVAIVDEAHRLKNRSSKVAETMKQLTMEHRILATGTPLQNRLEELYALLNFLEPKRFPSESEFLEQYGDLKKSEDVQKLQSILKPLMLRRLKEDVEKTIPVKEETVIEVELTGPQKKYYRAILERNFAFLSKGCKGANMPNLINTMMELRKCCIHPYLIKGAEDRIIDEANAVSAEEQFNLMVQASGKLVLVDKLLKKLQENGHKVLIFSQMTKCLDILADYLKGRGYQHERIDGAIRGELRQAAIDRFCTDENSFVFLLCTRAGGVGINLTAADTVVIFDSDWNPQNDLQAQARCHRIGQTKSVKIYRLITRNTYEQEMFDRASMKLGLDKALLQKMGGGDDDDSRTPQLSKKEVEQLLKKGAYGVMMENDEDAIKFCEEDIDQILARRTQVIVHENSADKGSIFSKASFTVGANDIDIEDPNFWSKWAAKANLDVDVLLAEDSLIIDEPRQRKQLTVYPPIATNHEEQLSEVSDGGYSGDEIDLKFGKKGPRFWSYAERLRLEKKLMTYGFGQWEQMLPFFSFRNRNDLVAVSKQLIKYALDRLSENDERLKNDFNQLVMPLVNDEIFISEDGEKENVIVENVSDDEEQVNDNYMLYPGASARKLVEYRSFLRKAPPEYREHVKKKSKSLLLRITWIHLLKSKIQYGTVESYKDVDLPRIIGTPPAPWWIKEYDMALAYGVCKHGFGELKAIHDDPELPFFNNLVDSNVEENEDDEDEDSDREEKNEDEESKEEIKETGTPPTPVTENVSMEIVSEVSTKIEDASSNGVSDAMEISDNTEKKIWPAKAELNRRVRRIMTAIQRRYHTDIRREAKDGKPRTEKKYTGTRKSKQPGKWSKRDMNEFVRVASCFGFPVPCNDGDKVTRDWSMFRALSHGLETKPDDVFDQFLIDFLPVAKEIADKVREKKEKALVDIMDVKTEEEKEEEDKKQEEEKKEVDEPKSFEKKEDKEDKPADVLTPERARRMLRKVEMLDIVRQKIICDSHVIDSLSSQVRRIGGLPSWWVPSIHDAGLLRGVSKYGFGRNDLITADKDLPFLSTYLSVVGQEDSFNPMERTTAVTEGPKIPSLPTANSLPKFSLFQWPKDAFVVKRIEYFCELYLKPAVVPKPPMSPKKKRKPEPLLFDPSAAKKQNIGGGKMDIRSLMGEDERLWMTSRLEYPNAMFPAAAQPGWNYRQTPPQPLSSYAGSNLPSPTFSAPNPSIPSPTSFSRGNNNLLPSPNSLFSGQSIASPTHSNQNMAGNTSYPLNNQPLGTSAPSQNIAPSFPPRTTVPFYPPHFIYPSNSEENK